MKRFWSKVRVGDPGECWLWVGGRLGKNYGGFVLEGEKQYAHRVAFFITHGRWPEPCCLHSCDTPLCVNPAHLVEGTQADNMEDMTVKGRRTRGEDFPQAKLNEARVEWARVRYAVGGVTMQWMADLLGVSKQQISRIIRGERWLTTGGNQ